MFRFLEIALLTLLNYLISYHNEGVFPPNAEASSGPMSIPCFCER